jgi:hypothetical protein
MMEVPCKNHSKQEATPEPV